MKKYKICPSCNIEKPISEFKHNARICHDCKKIINEKAKFHHICNLCNDAFKSLPDLINHRKNSHSFEECNKNHREASSYHASMRIINGGRFGIHKIYKPYRSKLEYIFALWLKDREIPIIYEKEAFALEDYNGLIIHYIPDFFIKEDNTYIEIVSQENRRNNKKATLFIKEYGKQFNLEIWTPKSFNDYGLIERYSDFLPV